MSRRTGSWLIGLAVVTVLLAGGFWRLRPAAASVGSASSSCASPDANTLICSLALDGTLLGGEGITVAIAPGTVEQVSVASGCQPGAASAPALAAGGASFTFVAPPGGCPGPIDFNETVGGLVAPGSLMQSVTDSGAPGLVLNTATALVSFSGSAGCSASAAAGAFACQLSLDASENLTDSTITVALSNGVFTGASFVSGCVNPPALSLSPTSFSITVPAGGCGGFGPLVVNETLAGMSGASFTQTVSASGMSTGLGSVFTQLPATAVSTMTLTGTAVCRAVNRSGNDDGSADDRVYADDDQPAGANCGLTLQPFVPLAAGVQVTIQINGNAVLTSVSYDSGCTVDPALAVSGASFSFVVPDGGCVGPLVFSESLAVTGAGGGPLAQTAIVAGASNAAATIAATRRNGSIFLLPNAQNDNGGNGNGGNDTGGGNGQGNGRGNGNGGNHSVPACQNSHGRAQQHNPHCQGGDD